MVNKVILVGNVGRDPETKALPSGQSVTTFSLATSRRWKGKDGERQEQTDWHNVVAFGRTAEVIAQYVAKGSKLYVEGRIQTRSWEDKKSGEKRYRTEIVADQVQFLGDKAEGSRSPSVHGRGEAAEHDDSGTYGGGYGSEDDDVVSF